MPKARFTVSDVAAMAREVRERCGDWRVNQIYDGDARTFVLKLQQSGIPEKRLLLLESGTKFLVTKFDAREDPQAMPSPLCSKLRSSLKGKRLTDVKALGRDRVVSLRFGAGPGTFNLFLELYAAGNVVLCDASYVVVAALRTDSLKVGDSYTVAVRAVAPPSELLPADGLQKFLEEALRTRVQRSEAAALAQQTKKKKKRRGAWTLAQLLLDRGSGVDAYGSDVVDHCIVASGLDGSLPLAEQPEDYVHKLHASLRAAPSLADAITTGTCGKPRLLLENDKFVSFAPGVFLQHEAYDVREFSSFCEAVDEYFRETKETKLQSKAKDATHAITAKVEKIRIDQKQRVDDLEASLALKERTASLLEERADQIDAVVQVLNNALQSGLRWDEVQDYVREEQAKGSPLASLIQEIDFEQRVVTVALDECSAKVSLDESARAASSTLWSLAKKARMKVTKTQEASVSVIKAAEKQADNKLKARAWQQDASRLKRQKSTQAWFQRFAWFVSSEGFLVVAPRDKGQCEQVLFGGVLRPTDALVLCEQNGPPTVVRARNGVLSPLALHEAGCFAACRSDAWQRRDRAPAYWVPGFSVRRVGSSNSTQVLNVLGDVAISSGTKKTYLPPTQLELTFALLFKLSDDSLEAHSGDRPGRVPDEELLRLTPSEEATESEEEVAPVVVEDALPPAPEPHFARTGKLTARERKLLKKYGGDIDAMREAEQRRIGSRTREGRRAPSPEPLPVDEEEEVPSPVQQKKTSRRQRGQKKKKNRRRDDSSEDEGPRVPLRLQKVPTISRKKKTKNEGLEVLIGMGFARDAAAATLAAHDGDVNAAATALSAFDQEEEAPPAPPSTAELLDGTSSQAVARLGPLASDAWARCTREIPALDEAAMAYELHRVADLNDDAKACQVFEAFLTADVEERERNDRRRNEAAAREKRTGIASDFVEAPRNLPALLSGICRRIARGDAPKTTKSAGIVIEGDDAEHVARLTGTPLPTDSLTEAVAVCCPTSACRGFAHSLKLQPGGTKKGRAARDALEILARAASDHVDLIRDVDANEAILALVGNTRVTHQAASQLKKDRAVDEKQNKKKKKTSV
ncbi:unnamed protein product [Pelagomonas calceolata]|uniref:UBA domain-containing protein n=1 Tax=Pelagomonas calceolata TaxID=35677 RepID=A0A8J2SL56_9STRA|nr:unnamed protein product [Pelagomonas calceolata]